MFYDVESSVEDFAVLFDFWKEGEAAEEEVKEAFNARVIKHGEIQGTLYWESKEAADAFLRDFPLRCIR